MWTITDYKMVYSRYESSGLSVEQFCWNERISRSRFYYWLRKYRKLTQKDVSIMNTAGDGFSRKHDPGFIPVLLSSGNESIYPLQSSCVSKDQKSSLNEPYCFMEICYQTGTLVRLRGEKDMELIKTLILLSR
jgi:hypothetical protein